MDTQAFTVETRAAGREELAAYDLATFCHRYSISRGSAFKEIQAGRLRVVRLGKKILVGRGEAEAWLRRLAEAI